MALCLEIFPLYSVKCTMSGTCYVCFKFALCQACTMLSTNTPSHVYIPTVRVQLQLQVSGL